MLRAEADVSGPVATDLTVSRLIDVLAAAGPKALTAIRAARAEVRTRIWELAGADSPDAGGSVIVVPGKGNRFRVQRDCLARGDVPAHDCLGAVVDDAHRHSAEVRERLPMAVEERRQVLAGGEAARRREYDSVMWKE